MHTSPTVGSQTPYRRQAREVNKTDFLALTEGLGHFPKGTAWAKLQKVGRVLTYWHEFILEKVKA